MSVTSSSPGGGFWDRAGNLLLDVARFRSIDVETADDSRNIPDYTDVRTGQVTKSPTGVDFKNPWVIGGLAVSGLLLAGLFIAAVK